MAAPWALVLSLAGILATVWGVRTATEQKRPLSLGGSLVAGLGLALTLFSLATLAARR